MTTISTNCYHRVVAQTVLPDVTVQIEESGLQQPDEPVVTVCYSQDVLYLLKPQTKAMRSWARFLADRNDDYVEKGDLAYSPPDIPLHVYTSSIPASSRSVACYFEPAAFRRFTGLSGSWDANRLKACHTIDGRLMRQVMEQLFCEMTEPGFASDIFVDSISRLLQVEIARYFKSSVLTREYVGHRLRKCHLDCIHEYVDSAEGHLTADDIARACNLSGDYLRRAFKNTTGESLRLYVERIRLSRAKALLAEQNTRIKQVSYRAGFANVKSFCVAFKRATGETPTEYQTRTSGS